jgi:hypothetical protein
LASIAQTSRFAISGPPPRFPSIDGLQFSGIISIVENFNNGLGMATVNFSVPDEIKAEFDRVFGGQNKSAVIADLMRKAVAEVKRHKRRKDIFRILTQRRKKRPAISDGAIRASRITGRP